MQFDLSTDVRAFCFYLLVEHVAILSLTKHAHCRKLKSDLVTAHKNADHHKLLAHTVSKSFAAAISENEQLREFARVAQQSAQASQQQSRHYQAEVHRLQKKLDHSLQLTTTPQAATSEHTKQLPGQELAAAKGQAQQVHQADPKCTQQAAGNQALQHRHAETQTEANIVSTLLDKQLQMTSEQEASDLTHPQNIDKAVQSDVGLHEKTPLQLELESVRSELLAMQQAAQRDNQQDNQHALLPVQHMLQQTEALLQSMTKLYQETRHTMTSFPGLRTPASCVSQPLLDSKVDAGHTIRSAVHKRQQQNDCELTGKRQKVSADAAAQYLQ